MTAPAPARDSSSVTANVLLSDVLAGFSEKCFLMPYGDRALVTVFGVRMVLGPPGWGPAERSRPATRSSFEGTIEGARLYRLVRDGPKRDDRTAAPEPVLFIRAGRLQDVRGSDLGSACEEVAFVLRGAARPAGAGAASSVASIARGRARRQVRALACGPDTRGG